MLSRYAAWFGLALVIAMFVWLRLGWIQQAVVTQQCLAGAVTIGCSIRAWAVAASHGWVTMVALLFTVLSLRWSFPLTAWLAAASGGVAMVLYHPEPGAAALLIGVLRLARYQVVLHKRA
ncbi:MAG: hypothetical protein EPN74_00010 [Rhodanobacter sp.]|nr:MAG: hypothetical protein EPN74_00010 [Rhodanobacter sp.]